MASAIAEELRHIRRAWEEKDSGETFTCGDASKYDSGSMQKRASALLAHARSHALLPSRNETLDGIPTGSLVLHPLLVYTSSLHADADPAAAAFELWCHVHESVRIGIVDPSLVGPVGNDDGDNAHDSDADAEAKGNGSASHTPMEYEARDAKVKRFKRKKMLHQRLNDLRHALEKHSAVPPNDESEHVDDERMRELAVAEAEYAALCAVDESKLLSAEAEMQAMHMKKPQQRSIEHEPSSSQKPRAVTIRPVDTARIARTRADSGLFRPYHQQPSMTVEEFGELQKAQLAAQKNPEQLQKTQEQDSNTSATDLEGDEEAKRLREWDDFRDAHPRGSGNSKLRPCA